MLELEYDHVDGPCLTRRLMSCSTHVCLQIVIVSAAPLRNVGYTASISINSRTITISSLFRMASIVEVACCDHHIDDEVAYSIHPVVLVALVDGGATPLRAQQAEA